MNRNRGVERAIVLALAALPVIATGCADRTVLMPTPMAYTHAGWDPFSEVPAALQGDTVSVLYITDRAQEKPQGAHQVSGGNGGLPDDPPPVDDGAVSYGYVRSRSMAFGDATVQFGSGMTWDEIVAESRTDSRKGDIEIKVVDVRERARFAETPPRLVITDAQMAAANAAKVASVQGEAETRFMADLSARLQKTPRKEVYLYVHGFNNTFDDAVLTVANLWHFLGREGVPVAYTWPAGVGGLLAYEYTVGSTEFTIYHLKQAIKMIAANPDVHKINIIAHSRGTAVATDAVRELYLEFRATEDVQKKLKFGAVVLAAPDIDMDVAIQRDATERVGRAVERSVVYISEGDKALGLSGWLFGGIARLGDVDTKLFSDEEIEVLRHSKRFQMISAQVTNLGDFGHVYFYANPYVSSDLVLMMRYGLDPGAAGGRPLGATKTGLWAVEDGYPGKDWVPPTTHGTPATPANPATPATPATPSASAAPATSK